jgi:hypothetical protein
MLPNAGTARIASRILTGAKLGEIGGARLARRIWRLVRRAHWSGEGEQDDGAKGGEGD